MNLRHAFQALSLVAMSYALAACPPPANQAGTARSSGSSGSRRTPVENDTPVATPRRATSTANATVEAPQGVTAVTTACAADRPESCNGLDDNCDGVIDNNCGYLGGGVQVTASWRGNADIDLRVTDPSGEELYFGHRQTASGGQMDMDANGECTPTRPTAENVRWATQTPPSGRYEIKLAAFDLCGAADATATISVSVGGHVVGSWTANFTYPRQEYVFPLTVR
mgnify:CR=1 FL=1